MNTDNFGSNSVTTTQKPEVKDQQFPMKKKATKKKAKRKLVLEEIVMENPSMTLASWEQFIQDQINEYGYETVMRTKGNLKLIMPIGKIK